MRIAHLDDRIGPSGETRQWLILASLRAGGFPQIAAAAYGVPQNIFARWLSRGRSRKQSGPFRAFARQLGEAAARARLKAEMAVYRDDPRFWLRHGPGKETRQAPGWPAPAKPLFEIGDDRTSELLTSPVFHALHVALRRALQLHPDVLGVVSSALDSVSARFA